MKNGIISPFDFGEPTVIGEKMLSLKEDTTFYNLTAATVLQPSYALCLFFCHVHAFLRREFLIVG
jgi:hypothetical protein